MTDEEWEMIRPYAEADAKARMALEARMIMNMPTEPRAALQARIDYERAVEEVRRAAAELESVKDRILGKLP